MKKKILSLALCLMLCLTSGLFFSACKKNPENQVEVLAQHDAEVVLESAMQSMATATSIKMTSTIQAPAGYQGGGSLLLIASEAKSYLEVGMSAEEDGATMGMTMKNWIDLEDGVYTTHSYMAMQEDQDTEEFASVSLSLEDQSVFENDYTAGALEGMDFDNFTRATKKDGEINIVFSDEYGSVTAKIVNNKLVSITIVDEMMTMTLNIFTGDFLSEIPGLLDIDWTMESSIEVKGIKTEFTVGEELTLENLNFTTENTTSNGLFFYETAIYEAVKITTLTDAQLEEIVTGFDTETVTEEGSPRTMTFTYLGLTCEVEYTVVAAE